MDKIIQKLKELKRRANIAMLERLYKFHIRIRYGHDYVYSKGGWYKNYSDKGYTQAIHKISVITFALSFVVFTVLQSLWPYLFSLTPRRAQAGANSVTWTSQGDFNSNDVTGQGTTTKSQQAVSAGGDYTIGSTGDPAIDPGTGNDGAITISTAKVMDTDTIASGRTCADAINYSVTALTSNTVTLSSTPGAGCLSDANGGDEVLLINLKGISSNYTNVGNYETLRISSVSSNVITFTSNKTRYYGNGASDDTNIGTAGTNQRVMLQRVPNYTNVTINTGGSLTPTAWNGTKGGVLFLRANGTVTVNVVDGINANSKGFTGGVAPQHTDYVSPGGESYNGVAASGAQGSMQGGGGGEGAGLGGVGFGGGGGGRKWNYPNSAYGGAGGGGGNGAIGNGGGGFVNGSNGSGNTGGVGGSGNTTTSGGGGGAGTDGRSDSTGLNQKIYLGGGAGAGGAAQGNTFTCAWGVCNGGNGGNGGGVVIIHSNNTTVASGGSIRSTGSNGSTPGSASLTWPGGGGGGAGGSIAIFSASISNSGSVTADGGTGSSVSGGKVGGSGGGGRTFARWYSGLTGSNPSPNYSGAATLPYYTTSTIGGTSANAVGLRIDAGNGSRAKATSLTWNGTTGSTGQKILFKVRAGDTQAELDTNQCYGPSALDSGCADWSTAGEFFSQINGQSNSSTTISSSLPDRRYIEVLVRIESNGQNTPTLSDVTLNYDTLEAPTTSNTTIYKSDGSTKLKSDTGVEKNNGEVDGFTNETTVKITSQNLTCGGGASGQTACTVSSTNRKIQAQASLTSDTGFSTVISSDDNVTTTTGSGENQTSTATLTGLSPGVYHIRIRTIDSQGRVSGWLNYGGNAESAADFTIEQTSPTGTVSVAGGAAYTGSNLVNLTVSGSDTGGSNISQMRFSNDGSTWSDWETYATSKSSWNVTSGYGATGGDGSKTVYLQVRDNAGNVSGKVFSSQADWQAATGTNLNTSSSSGDVKITNNSFPSFSNSEGGSWNKKKELTISNFQSNYQLSITVPYDSDMQADFDDIRFYDETAGQELSYQIETKTDSISALVWLKSSTNNNISLYYGNSLASSSSNGLNTFEFFDDFNSYDTSKWTNPQPGGVSIDAGKLKVTPTTNCSGCWTGNSTKTQQTFGLNTVVEFYASMEGGSSENTNQYGGFTTRANWGQAESNSVVIQNYRTGSNPTKNYFFTASSGAYSSTLIANADSNYHKWGIFRTSSLLAESKKDDIFAQSLNTNIPSGSLPILFQAGNYNNSQNYSIFVDWVRVRTYATTEPTVSLGSEIPYFFTSATLGISSPFTGLRTGTPGSSPTTKWSSLVLNGTGITSTYKVQVQVRPVNTSWPGDATTGYVNPSTGASASWHDVISNSTTINLHSSITSSEAFEVKLQLVGDGQDTPTLHDIAVQSASLDSITLDIASPAAFELSSPSTNAWSSVASPTLSWNASSDGNGLSKYQLYINGSLDKDNISNAATSTTPTSPLTAGTYTWYIKAVDNAGNVTQSTSTYTVKVDLAAPVVSGITLGTAAPATDQQTSINVILSSGTATDDGEIAGYRVFRKEVSNQSPSTPVLTAQAGTGLAAGAYKYFIVGYDATGLEIEATAESSITTQASTQNINITWSSMTGATGYKVYRTALSGATDSEKLLKDVGNVTSYTDNATDTLTATDPTIKRQYKYAGNATSFPYTVTGLTNGQTYSFYIKAYDQTARYSPYTGNISGSTDPSRATVDTTSPQAPSNLTVTPTIQGDRLDLSWSGGFDGAGVTKYRIYMSTTLLGTYTAQTAFDVNITSTINDTGNTRNQTITGLIDNKTYYFKVSALDASSNESLQTSEQSGTPPDVTSPALPSLTLTATPASANTVNLLWTSATDYSSDGQTNGTAQSGSSFTGWYKLYRDTASNGSFATPAGGTCATTTSTSCTDSGLSALSTYYYKIKAVDKAGSNSNADHAGNNTSSLLPASPSSATTYTDQVPTSTTSNSASATLTGGNTGREVKISFTGAASSTYNNATQSRTDGAGFALDYYRIYRFPAGTTITEPATTNGAVLESTITSWAAGLSGSLVANTTYGGGTIAANGNIAAPAEATQLADATNQRDSNYYEFVDNTSYANVVDSGLTDGTTYQYVVVAFDKEKPWAGQQGNVRFGTKSSTITVTTPDTAASTEPTSVTNSTLEGANGSMPRLVVSWTVPTQSLRATTSTVSSLSSTNGTSLAVSAGTGLQFVTGQFIKIDSEILKITNIATDTLTVTRATNGSTAATHSAGAAISILDFTAYKLYKNSGLGYEEITSTTFDAMNENYYVDADIQQGYVYTYKVTIVDDAGRFKGYVSNQANQIVNSRVNNESTGITTTYDPSADLVAPTITYTNQAVSNGIGYSVTPTSATISWTTDESSSSVIEYGTSNSLGSTYGTSTGVTYHEVTIPNLTPQTTYYFIIKSSDGAENLTTKRNTGEIPFTLTTTLDTIAPSNPTTINAWNANTKDSTLTSGNWYNYQTPRFEWSGATDTESAISGYFVYFGTSSSGSPTSYQLSASPNFYTASTLTSGNTYYLRVKTRDAGNNDSSATTLFEYKYDGTAPTSTITSPSASANLSDVNSVTGTAVDTYSNIQNAKVSVKRNSDNKYLNSGKTAFDQATEVFIDATGQGSFTLDTSTVTWADSTYTITSKATDTTGNAETPSISTTFRIDNTAPPQVDLVAPVNISNVSTSTPTFVWNATEDSGSGLSYFELYIDGVLNTDNPQAIPVTDLNSSIRKKIITPLSEGSHTWYVKAYDRVGNSSSSASTLTVNVDLTKPTSTITSPSTYQYLNTNTLNITGTATKSATSNAEINSVQVSITKRGTSLNWVNVSSLSSSGSTRNWSYTWNIPSNDDGEYFIISKAIDTAGNEEAYKAGMTVAVDKTNPSISTSSITDITTTSLNINFETTEEVTYTLDYGTTLSYGSSFPISTFNTKSTARLTGLTEGKTYNYRITITDRAGNTVASINATFNMNALDHAAPVISGFAISSVTENSAIVSWNTDEVATTQVEYAENSGFTSSSLSPTSVDNTNLNKVHRVTLSGLTSNTLYYIKAKATDSSGNASETAGNDNFTTLRVPVVSPVTIQVTENATDKSITITWTSDEATSSIVQYAPETGFTGYDTEKTDGKVTLSTDHSVTLTDLAPLTTYKFRVGGTNAQSISSYQTATPDTFDTDFIDRVAPTITFSNQTLGNLSVQSHGSGIQPGVSSAVIKWDTDEGADSVIEYKKQGDSEYRSGNIDPKLLTQDHTVTLRSLTPSTTYVFRIKSRDNAGNLATSSEYSFTTLSLGIGTPVVATTSSSATVSWSTSIDSTSQVEYQKQNSNTPSKIDGDANLTKTHSVTIKNLSSGRYSYKVKSIDNDTNIAESNLLTFEIPSADSSSISAPQAGKIEEKDITATSAKITWTSTMQTTSWVDYGNTSGTYTLTTGNDVMTSDHVVTLDNLTPGLTYYYIVRGKDANGIEYKSEEFTFIAIAKPSVSSIKVTGVSSYKAIVLIDVTKETQLTVNYGKDRSFDLKAGGATLAKTHEVTLNDLEDGSAYFLNAEVKDVAGNSAVSETITFNTPLDTTGPAVKEVKIDLLPMGTDDETAQAIISWTTDKPSITQLEYDEGIVGNTYSQKTIPDESLKNAHTVIIKELNPSATYRFRIIGKDKKNNITRSNNYNFVTPNKEKSILQLIIRSLEETFSWVKDVGKKFTEVREKVFGK